MQRSGLELIWLFLACRRDSARTELSAAGVQEMAAIVYALSQFPDVSDALEGVELQERQDALCRAIGTPRSWSAVYLKLTRCLPKGLGKGELLHRKLGDRCRQYARQPRGRARHALVAPWESAEETVPTGVHLHEQSHESISAKPDEVCLCDNFDDDELPSSTFTDLDADDGLWGFDDGAGQASSPRAKGGKVF